jgi:hypothetical protein
MFFRGDRSLDLGCNCGAKRSNYTQAALGSIPSPIIWGALGIAAISAVLYFWPERKVRMI